MSSGCLERGSGEMGPGIHLGWGSPVGQLGWEIGPREWLLHLGNLTSESVCGCSWFEAHTQRGRGHMTGGTAWRSAQDPRSLSKCVYPLLCMYVCGQGPIVFPLPGQHLPPALCQSPGFGHRPRASTRHSAPV